MKTTPKWLLCGASLLAFSLSSRAALAPHVSAPQMEQCAQWMAPRFQRAPVTQSLPFHFIYQGTGSDSLLQGCTPQVIQRTLDENRTQEQWIYTLTDGLEIRCEMVRYADYPAVEWTLYLKNNGSARSGILEQIEALHAPFHPRTQSTLYLNYNEGGHSGDKDFAARRTTLNNGGTQTMGAFWGGFPTAENLPFFNAEWCGADTSGIMVGVGWPARWQTSFLKTADSVLTICVGQIKTHLYLNPGEEIRTPLVALMFWQGNRDQAQNMWRGWMYDHNLPRPDGKLPPPILEAASSAFFAEMFHATDKDQIEFIDRYLEEDINLDYWWMDAGWYPNRGGSWQDLLGTWYPDPKRYPNGLKAISDHAHQRGVKSLLWFEPERVTEGSWIFQYHPEWTLGSGNPRFFNYGNPEALAWMIHHTDSLLKSEHIDLYRQDFAVFSDGYWNGEDQKDPDRQGIAEIRHVIGYLQYMDELQRRHPKMLIDICAAGGKRLELENLRRAVPLWRSDYAFEPRGVQGQTYGLSAWVPFSGAGVNQIDTYAFRSNMSPSIVLNLDARVRDANYPLLRQLLSQWRTIYDDYRGDYYPLTNYSLQNDVWMGWEFFRPETGTGFVQMFNRPEAPYREGTCRLKGLDRKKNYRITDFDSGQSKIYPGEYLLDEGMTLRFAQAPEAKLLRIQEEK